MHATSDVRLDLRIAEDKSITVGALAKEFHDQGLGRIQFEQLIERLDDRAVRASCGKKHKQGNGTKRYQRSGTDTRSITTVLGESTLRLTYVEDTTAAEDEQSHFRPIEEILTFNGQKQYQQCISFTAATFATKTSYRDAAALGDRLLPMLSPASINRRVIDYGPQLQEHLAEHTEDRGFQTVIPDGTKLHSQEEDAFHDIHVSLSRGGVGEEFETSLLDVSVDEPWETIATDLTDRSVITDDAAVVSDGEKSLIGAFCHGDRPHQFDLVHAPRSLMHTLWEDAQLPLKKRKAYTNELCGDILHLKNSVELHHQAEDWDAIRTRIASTEARLERTAWHLELDGCTESARFVRKWKPGLTRFAEAAIEGRRIPWTSNAVERVMGEVSKRCKHQWMRWTRDGSQAMLTLTSVNVIHPELYADFARDQIGTDATTNLAIEVETGTTRDQF